MEENNQSEIVQPAAAMPTSPAFGNWWKIGILTVGLVLAGSIVYAGYQFSQKPTAPAVISPTNAPVTSAVPQNTPSPTPDETAGWKTYNKNGLLFRYPFDWMESDYVISSSSPKIKLLVIPKDSTLMNECMQETATENKDSFVIKKFKRVTTGAMCGTSDSTPREIWIMPSATIWAPGIMYQYSSLESLKAEMIFDQILSTFKFLE